MLNFLKWIFLIFGGLGLIIMSFFYIQNRKDLHLYFDNKDKLDYETIRSSCPSAQKDYYFDCFLDEFREYAKKVSLTGISLGLKTGFSFIDEDKLNNKKFTKVENDVRYALNHLHLNNIVLENCTSRFHGLEFTYGGYIGKVKDFLDKGISFSDGIIAGLKSSEGISSLKDAELEKKYLNELEGIEAQYQLRRDSVTSWLDAKISTLKEKHKVD